MNSEHITPEPQAIYACLTRTQSSLLRIVEDIGQTIGTDAAAAISTKAVALFSAIEKISREAQ